MSTDPTKVRVRGAKRAEKIKKVAAELFLKRGYERVTVDEVARRAGGSKSTVYEQFGGKDGVFSAATEYLIHNLSRNPLFASDDSNDQHATLGSICVAAIEVYTSPHMVEFYRLALSEGERYPELAQAWLKWGPDQVISRICCLLNRSSVPGKSAQAVTKARIIHDAIVLPHLLMHVRGQHLDDEDTVLFIEARLSILNLGE